MKTIQWICILFSAIWTISCGGEELVSKTQLTLTTLQNQGAMVAQGSLTITPYSIDDQLLYKGTTFDLSTGKGSLPSDLELGQWKYFYTGVSATGAAFFGESATINVEENQGIGLRALVGQSNCVGDVLSDMPAPEAAQAVAALPDGRVLITGGGLINGADGSIIGVSKLMSIYDPNQGVVLPLALTLSEPRAYHTATVLEDGKVLLTGGLTLVTNASGQLALGISNSAELIDLQSNTITALPGVIGDARYRHTATTLADKTVLIVGGFGLDPANPTPLATVTRYFPTTGQFMPQGNLKYPRAFHATSKTTRTTELAIVTGGLGANSAGAPLAALAQTELFVTNCAQYGILDVVAPNGCFIDSGATLQLGQARWGHSAVSLNTYGVEVLLIAGGFTAGSEKSPQQTTPKIEIVQTAPNLQKVSDLLLPNPRGLMGAAAVFDSAAGQTAVFAGGRDDLQSYGDVVKVVPTVNNGQLAFYVEANACPLFEKRHDIQVAQLKTGALFVGGILRGGLNGAVTHLPSKRVSLFYPVIQEADLASITK